VVKILQGSVVTKTTLGGLTTYSRVANFLQCICTKNYENWLAVDKVIAKIIRLTFFWPTLYIPKTMTDSIEIPMAHSGLLTTTSDEAETTTLISLCCYSSSNCYSSFKCRFVMLFVT